MCIQGTSEDTSVVVRVLNAGIAEKTITLAQDLAIWRNFGRGLRCDRLIGQKLKTESIFFYWNFDFHGDKEQKLFVSNTEKIIFLLHEKRFY